MPNWLDLIIIIWVCFAGISGYRRGFIVEVCSLLALFAGIHVAVHCSGAVASWLGISPDRTIIAFLVTFIIVVVLMHLLAKALTTLIDLAMLGLANRIAGVVAGMVRSLFMMSVVLNLLLAYSDGTMPPADVREGSRFAEPIRAFAPVLIPGLGETKWVNDMIRRLQEEVTVEVEPA
jgi:membrane protein required for colicin V production